MLVRSNGDTLRGEIENGFWNEPPTFVRFRPTADSPAQQFEPAEVRAFNFTDGRHFRYETLPIDQAAETRLSRLPRGNATNVKSEALLAEVLVDGPCSLLRVATLGTVHYLLRCPGRDVLDLSERKYLSTSTEGTTVIADGNNYRSQLNLYFLTCPAARKAAETAAFTTAALAAVVQAYNQQCDATHQLGRNWLAKSGPRRQVSLQGGVLAGLRYNMLDSPTGSGSDCADCQMHPFAGLYADLFLPGRTTAAYGELSGSRFRSSGVVDYGVFQTSYYDYEGWLATARIGIRRFILMPHEQQLIIGIGYELNRVWRPTLTSTSGPVISSSEANLTFATPTLLPNVALGWRNRRFTISLDGQLYQSTDDQLRSLFGKGIGVRLSTAYRLGRNYDAAPRQPTGKH
ncbi:hypothetical protein AUC43_18160 [Hymenobacter sedentarius]|uniref:Uncharacterized protein n=1 Tax=Hymenobacter sedentarius TaxID=1411621 RepID=A0A0U4C2D3_9BACT|nr:hypothetical protein AUC43_18160 [Hymenobacter sedentarius]